MIIEHDIGAGIVLSETRATLVSLRPEEVEVDKYDLEKYKLTYHVEPDEEYTSPTDAPTPEDVTDIECNSVITLASPLETTWTTSDGTESGVPGDWTFKGWYSDAELTTEITETEKIWADRTVFGSWAFAPSPAPEPEEPEDDRSEGNNGTL